MSAAQPYRGHLKDMMERQDYPTRLLANGDAEPPYDVAGWTLPLQMGVDSVAADRPISGDVERVDRVEMPKPAESTVPATTAVIFTLANRANDDFQVLNALHEAKVPVRMVVGPAKIDGRERPPRNPGHPRRRPGPRRFGSRSSPSVSSRVRAETSGITVEPEPPRLGTGVRDKSATPDLDAKMSLLTLIPQRIAVYQPWVPSMDEGWTRLVLENFRFPFTRRFTMPTSARASLRRAVRQPC